MLSSIAQRIDFYDYPSEDRKHHLAPIPPVGGIAMFIGILITYPFYDLSEPNSFAFISALTLLVFVGAIDDYRGLSVKFRLGAQVCAGLIMTEVADIRITDVGDLLGHGTLYLGQYSTALTVFAVVGGINAFNMIDGIDGLCGSLALLSLTLIALLAAFVNNPVLLNLSLIIIGALIGFLMFNLRIFGRTKAVIFLGDSGSTLLGFVICWLIISGSQGDRPILTPTLVLWLIALPLFDSICIMMRRIFKGKSPFSPDREHIHYVLLRHGFRVSHTVNILFILATTLAVASLSASFFFAVKDYILFEIFLGCFGLFYIFMSIANRKKKI